MNEAIYQICIASVASLGYWNGLGDI